MNDERKAAVAAGYDAIAGRYADWSARVIDPGRARLVADFVGRLPRGAEVLDLGCGAGLPSTRALAERFSVTGVDVSAAQIEAARRNVPDARFIHADMSEVVFEPGSFDGAMALYAVSHVPRDEHASLLSRIGTWLRPGGLLLVTLAARDTPDWTGEWLGTPMFFSGFDAKTNRSLVAGAGFDLLVADVIFTIEPEGPIPFLWVLARRAVGPAPKE